MALCSRLFGSQIPVTTAGFELRISCIQSKQEKSNSLVVTGISDPNKSQSRRPRSLSAPVEIAIEKFENHLATKQNISVNQNFFNTHVSDIPKEAKALNNKKNVTFGKS